MRTFILASALVVFGAGLALAASEQAVEPREITEWKAVFGRVEARDMIPARSRIGGTLVSVDVTEGSAVTEGQVIADIYDPKLNLQLASVQGEIDALLSQLDNAETELKRGEDLLARGVTTAQRLDALRTQVDVFQNQIVATRARKNVIEEQAKEGAVLAPMAGKVIEVPVTRGSVVMPGEAIAQIGGGGFFLRLAVPERYADYLKEGIEIRIGADGESKPGRLAKVYPQIENGRVIADVEVEGMSSEFVNARVLVSLPVGKREALVVPADGVQTRMGLDFVTVRGPGGAAVERAVVLGESHTLDGMPMVEVLSGLSAGDVLVFDHE